MLYNADNINANCKGSVFFYIKWANNAGRYLVLLFTTIQLLWQKNPKLRQKNPTAYFVDYQLGTYM